MQQVYSGLLRGILLTLAFGWGISLQAQTITLGTPTVGSCVLSGDIPTSLVEVEVSWTNPPLGDLIEVTLAGASSISTNPVLINPASAVSPMTVSFTTLSDGSTGATISASFRTPIAGTTSGTQTTAAFDIAANTCTGGSATICTDGTNSLTLTPADDPTDTDDTYSNVMWFAIDGSGTQTLIPVANYGGNNEIVITYNGPVSGIAGVANWSDLFFMNGSGEPEGRFYYTATDENGCAGELCVPVTVNVEACYDLALTKVINTGATPGPFVPGDAVQFTISITNQGARTAYDISVVDYIPTGLINVDVLEGTASTGVVIDNGGGSLTLDELASGATATVDISFTIDAGFMGTTLLNAAEISSFFKDAAGTIAAADEDSTPDSVNGEDGAGAELTNDNVITDLDDGSLQDDDPIEDDYDPALVMVNQSFDLALTKVESSTGPYVPGGNTVFTITVFNQGTLDATAINITDYIPSDMNYTATGSSATGTLTTTGGATVNLTNNGDGTFVIDALASGDEVSFDIGLSIASNFMGTSITNFAEITDADNALGQDDEDDDLDDPNNQGPGNAPNETDNDVNDNPDNAADQDDFDPATITVNQSFDLALTKVLNTGANAGPYTPGTDVIFTITAFNQGTLDATAINITDYIPSDMSYTATGSSATGALTTMGGATVNLTNNGDGTFVIDALASGDQVSFDIALTIDANFMGTSITNNAEITDGDNALGQDDEDDDLDDPNNQGPGNAPNEVNDDVNDNPDNPNDQDDFDGETFPVTQVFDLALTKVESSTGPYTPGSNTVFTITVFNQRTLDATAINITDYIPSDMSYTATGSSATGALTTVGGATVNLTNNGDGTFVIDALASGDEVSFDIGLTISSSFMGTSIINNAEITDADNALNQDDEDDDLDDPNNQGPGNAPNETDNDVNDNPDNPNDQDDFDLAPITVNQSFDLALTKVESSTGPYVPGGNTVFTITVFNQGTLDATAINITDYIPSDMSYTATGSSATGALTTVGGATVNLTNNGDGTFVIDALASGDEVSFDIGLMIASNFMGTSITNFAEITDADNALNQDDEDDDLDDPNNQGPGNAGNETDNDVNDNPDNAADQDDFDPATITVNQSFDLALTKVLNTGANAGPYTPGTDVIFTITAFNQGTLDATAINITDYIPSDMSYTATGSSPTGALTTLGGATVNLTNNGDGTFVIDALASGDQVSFDIALTIDANFMGTSITNNAEITDGDNALGQDDEDDDLDDPNNQGPGNAPNEVNDDVNDNPDNPNDQDDFDGETFPVTQVFDLALTKVESSTGPYVPGGNTVFTITVFNQGTLDATAINITDYIPSEMSYTATGSSATGALTTVGGATVNLTNNGDGTFVIDALAAGDEVSFDIGLTISSSFMGTSIINNAEITDADNALGQDDEDDDLDDPNNQGPGNAPNETDNDVNDNPDNPDDQDDFDLAPITVNQSFDLALTKVESSTGPYVPGGNTVFTITVFNQGTLDATAINITDYIPSDMSYTATGSSATGALTTVGGATVNLTNNGDGTFVIDALASGDEVSFDIGLMINANFLGTSITNNAEITDADNALNQDDEDDDLDDPNNQGVANADNETDNDVDDEAAGTPGVADNPNDQDDFDLATISIGQVDYGDLADTGNGTGTGDYQTLAANGGPSHVIVPDLTIGATVDNEVDGQQSTNADGDDANGDDEDGVDLNGLTFQAGQTVSIPVVVTNNTGSDANLYAFVDWNNDGDFGDAGEQVLVSVPSMAGPQTILVDFTIPTEAAGTDINSTVGARFRLTTDTLAGNAWEGAATDGEVEDYTIQISCPTGNCFGVEINVQDN